MKQRMPLIFITGVNIITNNLNIHVTPINTEYKVLLIGNFDNAQAAAEYVQTGKTSKQFANCTMAGYG